MNSKGRDGSLLTQPPREGRQVHGVNLNTPPSFPLYPPPPSGPLRDERAGGQLFRANLDRAAPASGFGLASHRRRRCFPDPAGRCRSCPSRPRPRRRAARTCGSLRQRPQSRSSLGFGKGSGRRTPRGPRAARAPARPPTGKSAVNLEVANEHRDSPNHIQWSQDSTHPA